MPKSFSQLVPRVIDVDQSSPKGHSLGRQARDLNVADLIGNMKSLVQVWNVCGVRIWLKANIGGWAVQYKRHTLPVRFMLAS